MAEEDDFLVMSVLCWERDNLAVLEVVPEMAADVRTLVSHVLWTDQSHDATWHQPVSGAVQELHLYPATAIPIIEGWVQPDHREAVHRRAATEEGGGCKDVGIGKGRVKDLGTAVIKLDCVHAGPGTAKQITELCDGGTFTNTRIEDGERITYWWTEEGCSEGNGGWRGSVEATFHLGSESHRGSFHEQSGALGEIFYIEKNWQGPAVWRVVFFPGAVAAMGPGSPPAGRGGADSGTDGCRSDRWCCDHRDDDD
jgi:hypothetical protein